MFYQNYSNVFVILDYEITADSVVIYAFYTNYTQTAIACGEIIINFDRDVFI